ncbi:hypothetical protein PR048_011256 [Dryococelus australis]|uniref:Uncharacterized protein n=1 Tax=Dryococelus australis TaxID=614101 RepID=A0ABQ9HL17_9NEOP|nr:hypothetical protein PR048_011256 [Dryococelus australis]
MTSLYSILLCNLEHPISNTAQKSFQMKQKSNDNVNDPKPTTSRGQVFLNSIEPIPVANRPRATKRKIPNISASILTSTPVIDFLLEKEHDKENKSKPKEERNAKIAAKKLFQKSTEPQENTQPILCPGCEEEFVDPPDEDWVKCGTCEQ